MRTLEKIDEFRREAKNAVFTKQQAVAITMNLLDAERRCQQNTDEENRILTDAMQRITFQYLDETASETDELLDRFNVARLTSEDILKAIDSVLFDCK